MAIAERHRQHIAHWFYPCSPSAHGELGELYVNDGRFAASIDKYRPGPVSPRTLAMPDAPMPSGWRDGGKGQ